MASNNQPRRQWIVNPRFQLQFAVVLVLLHINVGFLYQVALHYRMRSLAQNAGSLDAFLDIEPWASIWPAMAAAALVSGVIVFFVGIRYSNQIVGPLPRVAKALQDLSLGKRPERLTFRPGDVLEDLAFQVNAVSDKMHPADPARNQSADADKVDPASILGPRAAQSPVGS